MADGLFSIGKGYAWDFIHLAVGLKHGQVESLVVYIHDLRLAEAFANGIRKVLSIMLDEVSDLFVDREKISTSWRLSDLFRCSVWGAAIEKVLSIHDDVLRSLFGSSH